MTTIEIKTIDQELAAAIFPKISTTNYNSVRLIVDFDDSWNGYGKTAIFYHSENRTPYEKVLSADNICLVPPEVLLKEGHFFIRIKGAKADEVKMSEALKVKISDGMPVLVMSDPSESVYNQLLAAYGGANEKTAKALSEIAVERARVDALASLKSGSTTGDAELQDIRIGANGETYSSAGAAVRKQVAEVNGVLNGEGVTLNASDFETGSWAAAEGGYYASNLRIRNTTPVKKGDVISVNPNGQYVTVLIIENKSTVEILDTKSYTNAPFDFGCSYDGYAVFIVAFGTTSQIKITPEQLTAGITIYRALSNNVGRGKMIYPVEYELGNIDMSTGAIIYNGATTRVRTPEGYTIPLAKGDIIRLTSYQNLRFYVGWTLPDGTNGKKGWLTNDFVCPVNAEYVILVCNTTDTKLSSAEELGQFIEVQTSISNELIEKNFAVNQWQTKEINRVTKTNKNVRAINHRGYNTLAPENTLSAYRISKRMGFDYVECDVQFTSDGVPVLLHDGTVDRTSSGTGSISAMTFEQVRALDFGLWFSDTFAGEKIPSFEEFIALCKYANLHPYIELKAGTQAQIESLVDTVNLYGMKDGVSWISFNKGYLDFVKNKYSKARLGYLVNVLDSVAVSTAQSLKTDDNEVFINAGYASILADFAVLCANAGIPLEVWTVNDKNTILALPPYVSGVSSDKINANEVFYDNSAIDEKVVVTQGGDAVVYPVGLKGANGEDGKDGTQVVPNNGEETTEELSTLKVGDTNYSLPSGGGGGKLYKHEITFKCSGSTQTSQNCTIISTSPTKVTVGDFATNATTKEQTAAVIDNLINVFSPSYTGMSITHMFFVEPTAYLYVLSWSGTGMQLSLTGVTTSNVTEL